MSDADNLTRDQLTAVSKLMTGLYAKVMQENRLLISRLDAAGPLSEVQKAIINQWVQGLDTLDAASQSQLMDIRGGAAMGGLQ